MASSKIYLAFFARFYDTMLKLVNVFRDFEKGELNKDSKEFIVVCTK